MSGPADSIDARLHAVSTDFTRRQNRLFLVFAAIELPVLVVLAVLTHGFEVIDPELGNWLLLAAALIGGFFLAMAIVRQNQARTLAVARAKGENPLF